MRAGMRIFDQAPHTFFLHCSSNILLLTVWANRREKEFQRSFCLSRFQFFFSLFAIKRISLIRPHLKSHHTFKSQKLQPLASVLKKAMNTRTSGSCRRDSVSVLIRRDVHSYVVVAASFSILFSPSIIWMEPKVVASLWKFRMLKEVFRDALKRSSAKHRRGVI